ncbi:MAG: YraN family protein [Myxococcota bacterium]|jgi:putative endonuclease|nr:YraN family protein [Myxococcota bacterium]
MARRSWKQELGRGAEDAAVAHLEAQGWSILGRNFRARGGELDIIACRGEVLAFVEVRSRLDRGGLQGRPEESVTARKQQHLERAASQWIGQHDCSGCMLRFDVLGVDWCEDAEGTVRIAQLRHHAAAFEPQHLLY